MSANAKRVRTKTDGVYRVDYASGRSKYLAAYRTPDGKQRTRSFATFQEARDFKVGQEAAKVAGTFRDTSRNRTTVEAAMRVRAGRPSKRGSTQARERSFIDNHVARTALGDTLLVRATHHDVQEWVNDRAAHMSAATLRQGLKYVRAAFNAAARTGDIPRSPISGRDLDVPEPDAKQVWALSEQQAAALVEHAPTMLKAALVFALGAGLRPGELLGLRRRDLVAVEIPAGRFVAVREQLRPDGTTGPVKTRRGRRDVPLSATVCESLDEHLRLFVPDRPDAFVFTSTTGRHWSRQGYADALAGTVKRAGITGRVTPHTLRHSYASWLLDAGVSPVAVAELLGDTVPVVLATYAHMIATSNDRARSAVDAALSCCMTVVPTLTDREAAQ